MMRTVWRRIGHESQTIEVSHLGYDSFEWELTLRSFTFISTQRREGGDYSPYLASDNECPVNRPTAICVNY